MKRKVIKQGNGTLTITLPKQWTEDVGLKGGDEISLEQTENGVSISSEKSSRLKKITIDSSKFNERVMRLTLSAAHKAGFDEIDILYKDPSMINIVYELIKELYMGFSVVEQTNKRCVLKAIAEDKVEDFDTILRRAFMVALSMADSSLDMIKENKFSELKSLIPLEHFNNQLTNFCERVLNKKGYKNGSCFYYVVAWNLEKICDNYKYICNHYSENYNGDINKRIFESYKNVNCFFRKYYEVFYRFDIDELVKLTNEGKNLIHDMRMMHRYINNESDFLVLSMLINTVLGCLDFSASYIAIRWLEKEKLN